jgi:importin subunit beta-1
MFDYVVSLREGIMDAWGGIIGAMKSSDQSMLHLVPMFAIANSCTGALLRPYVEQIFHLLNTVYLDPTRSEGLLRSAMGVIGLVLSLPLSIVSQLTIDSDLAETFPNGDFSQFYRAEWLMAMIKDTRSNREFQSRTVDTARWAREQVKRQIGGTQGVQQT